MNGSMMHEGSDLAESHGLQDSVDYAHMLRKAHACHNASLIQ